MIHPSYPFQINHRVQLRTKVTRDWLREDTRLTVISRNGWERSWRVPKINTIFKDNQSKAKYMSMIRPVLWKLSIEKYLGLLKIKILRIKCEQ